MEILLEQEAKLNTIAALSSIAVAKTDNTRTVASQYVQTDIVKGGGDDDGTKNFSITAAFNNLPPCSPVNISFKDIKYTVRKPFSKSELKLRNVEPCAIKKSFGFTYASLLIAFARWKRKRKVKQKTELNFDTRSRFKFSVKFLFPLNS